MAAALSLVAGEILRILVGFAVTAVAVAVENGLGGVVSVVNSSFLAITCLVYAESCYSYFLPAEMPLPFLKTGL